MRAIGLVVLTGAVLLTFGAGQARAAGAADGARLCAFTEVLECSPLRGCERVLPAAVGLPDFIRVDPAAGRVDAGVAGDVRQTTVSIKEEVEGLTILGGIENGRGGSATLSADGRRLTGAVAEGAGAFVLFGACTQN